MAVAQIPDLENWEGSARVAELDRGHLAVGQEAEITVIAQPERKFRGRIKSFGGTTGPPWDRHFECRLTIEEPTPELRPGMSIRVRIVTGVLSKALWIPSQALHDSDGRKFVYLRTGSGFARRDVKLVRRSESQAVLEDLLEGQVVALANPDEMRKQNPASRPGAIQAVSR